MSLPIFAPYDNVPAAYVARLFNFSTTEPATDNVACNATSETRCAESASSQVGRLAELVASGEGEGVHDCEDERNDCRITIVSS